MPTIYEQQLAKLKMPRADKRGGPLIGVPGKGKRWPKWLKVEETAALVRARRHGASHVFFRRFSESGRASVPQAYIQDKEPESWRITVNEWITQLKATPVDEAVWTDTDRLRPHKKIKGKKKVFVSESRNSRTRGNEVHLMHFFVDIRTNRQPELELD